LLTTFFSMSSLVMISKAETVTAPNAKKLNVTKHAIKNVDLFIVASLERLLFKLF
jgi:hypothetical protein